MADLTHAEYTRQSQQLAHEAAESQRKADSLRKAARRIDAETEEIRARMDALDEANREYAGIRYATNYGTGRVRRGRK